MVGLVRMKVGTLVVSKQENIITTHNGTPMKNTPANITKGMGTLDGTLQN